MLRRTTGLDVLISPTKQKVLAATLLQPQRSWYLQELARELKVTPSSIQRELALLTKAGLLERRKDGNRVYYRANSNSPIAGELSQILIKTVAVLNPLQTAIKRLGKKVHVAFVYGSVASSEERPDSDIDLMVIGTASLVDLSPILRKAERELARSINLTLYTTSEFSKRWREKNHFLRSALSKKMLFVCGSKDDLEALTELPAR